MSQIIKRIRIDWMAFSSALALALFGLLTMGSFTAQDPFFFRQALWLLVSVIVFFGAAALDWRFLPRGAVAAGAYLALIVPLAGLFLLGTALQGARSWFDLGALAVQPAEFAKIIMIIALAKYFSRRHIEIANFRHILVSGAYAAIVFVLIALQPDFGSAIIIAAIWLLMVLFSGISRKHLFITIAVGISVLAGLWVFGFEDYHKQRVLTFLNPLAHIHGAGYNAYQSTVAVGSGELVGNGVGYGTQSKLRFLPEYQTDFIFAAFAEEWGFVGVIMLFIFFILIIWRIIKNALYGATNFEMLFGLGLVIMIISHFAINVGMNIGLLPITGITVPFMSYGGTHLIAEFLALGILMGMRKH